jgi:hypothetical protein
MRTRPGSRFWACVYSILFFCQSFYSVFVWMWLMGGPLPDPANGFLFRLFGS